ncbi:MAG: hypothetical protein PHP42_08105 [Bacteroidota bacterium]|nr:hypothetical protein [Bacteroidota bacterium]
MKKYISILLIAIAVITMFTPVLTITTQTMELNDVQIQNTIGGQSAKDCAELLAVCAASTGGSIWCIVLAAVCLVA